MTLTMRTAFVWVALLLGLLAGPGTASAQYGTPNVGSGVVGEDYGVEFAYSFWTPERDIIVASESLGIIGTRIDVVEDLGFEKETFGDFRVVLRPSRKFKFRVGYTPIKYEAESVLNRTIVFNGQRYDVGLPVNSLLDWKAWRFGLQYDFIYRERGFLGFIAEVKYTDVRVELGSPITTEFTSVKVPIPTVGLAGRVYAAKNLALNGEITGLKLAYDDNEGTYLDYDFNATFNFTRNVGAQAGYRSLTVEYIVDSDVGDLNLKGFYFGGTVRF